MNFYRGEKASAPALGVRDQYGVKMTTKVERGNKYDHERKY